MAKSVKNENFSFSSIGCKIFNIPNRNEKGAESKTMASITTIAQNRTELPLRATIRAFGYNTLPPLNIIKYFQISLDKGGNL